jgi:hypothetical protein
MQTVYLLPVGTGRFELYSEPPEDVAAGAAPPTGFIRRTLHRMHERWVEAVQTARRPAVGGGRLARARDWVVSRIAEMIVEQRTLWALRHATSAVLVHPSDVAEPDACAARDAVLTRARRHHGVWLAIDGALFAASGVFILVPGPNFLAYYFGVRVVGHYLSWRGARQALDRTEWSTRHEPALSELGHLVNEPREDRASRVAAIAASLNLPRLAAFFDRAAVPAR